MNIYILRTLLQKEKKEKYNNSVGKKKHDIRMTKQNMDYEKNV